MRAGESRVTEYVRSATFWRLYVAEGPAEKIPSFTSWSGDGFIVDLDDARIVEAIPQFRGRIAGLGCAAKDILPGSRYAQNT